MQYTKCSRSNWSFKSLLLALLTVSFTVVSCQDAQIISDQPESEISTNSISSDSLSFLQSWADNQDVINKIGNDGFKQTEDVTVYKSGSNVTTWDPIFPSSPYANWASPCVSEPIVGIDANWVNPHNAYQVGTHPWEGYSGWDFDAAWINSWASMGSIGPNGQSWTKYSTTISGEGDYVVQFLADNCSWVYVDDQLIGVQDINWYYNNSGKYPVSLSGDHTLTYIIYDGGGLAGGKFRLETYDSYIDNGGDPDVLPEPSDDEAPVIDFGNAITNLWPPNHKMHLVASGISATDESEITNFTVSVSSNEASNGKGDGNTESDWEIIANNDGTFDVYVRAERAGKGQSRIYTITANATDEYDNSSSDSFEVTVAHDKGK